MDLVRRAREGLVIPILIRTLRSVAQSESIVQCLPMSFPKFGTMFYTLLLPQCSLLYIVPENMME